MPDSITSQEWTPRSSDLTALAYLVWDVLQELVAEERRKPFANFKDFQNVIRDKWLDVDTGHIAVKKHLAAVAKENGRPIQRIFC